MFAHLSLNGASGGAGIEVSGHFLCKCFPYGAPPAWAGVKLPSKCHHFQFYFHRPGATMLQLVLATSSIHLFAYYKVKGVELLQCRGTIYLLGHFFPNNFNISDVFSGLQIPDK